MNAHHKAWLDGHPNRAAGWLKDRLAEGFVVQGVPHGGSGSLAVLSVVARTGIRDISAGLGVNSHPSCEC